ncbi:hypothetical protein [Mycobacterium sp. OAE908]|uniref:hypothetical protein n=1 Tax=Mycobacterium sp. OAE908 TaxID=2817899 RepID=UPI001AE61656
MGTHRITKLVPAAMTAAVMFLAPVGAAIATSGVAYAGPPGEGGGGTCGPGNPGCPGSGPGGTGAPGTTVSGIAQSSPGALAGTRPGQDVKATTPGAGKGKP